MHGDIILQGVRIDTQCVQKVINELNWINVHRLAKFTKNSMGLWWMHVYVFGIWMHCVSVYAVLSKIMLVGPAILVNLCTNDICNDLDNLMNFSCLACQK